jgi:hypothetical protein
MVYCLLLSNIVIGYYRLLSIVIDNNWARDSLIHQIALYRIIYEDSIIVAGSMTNYILLMISYNYSLLI